MTLPYHADLPTPKIKGKKCETLSLIELKKVERNGKKAMRCPKFSVGRTFTGEYGYWKSHITLKLE